MKKLAAKLFDIAMASMCGMILGGLVATKLLPYAWAERGFRGGIGGEWVLVGCAMWLGWYLYREVLQPILDGGAARA